MMLGYSPGIYSALGNPGWSPSLIAREQMRQAGVWPAVVLNPPAQQQQQKLTIVVPKTTPAWATTEQKQQQAGLATDLAPSSEPAGNAVTAAKEIAQKAVSYVSYVQNAAGGEGGGGGVAYGGHSFGPTISIGGSTINVPGGGTSPAPSGGAISMPLIVIGGLLLVGILAIALRWRHQ